MDDRESHREEDDPTSEEADISFHAALCSVVPNLDVPFGYTLSIWSAGRLAVERFGDPSLAAIVLFVAGAIVAYLLLLLPVSVSARRRRAARGRRASLLNIVALAAAVVVSGVSRLVESPLIGFLLAGFVATFTYTLLLVLSTYIGWRVRSG